LFVNISTVLFQFIFIVNVKRRYGFKMICYIKVFVMLYTQLFF